MTNDNAACSPLERALRASLAYAPHRASFIARRGVPVVVAARRLSPPADPPTAIALRRMRLAVLAQLGPERARELAWRIARAFSDSPAADVRTTIRTAVEALAAPATLVSVLVGAWESAR